MLQGTSLLCSPFTQFLSFCGGYCETRPMVSQEKTGQEQCSALILPTGKSSTSLMRPGTKANQCQPGLPFMKSIRSVFIVSEKGKAYLVDFNYDTEPLYGKYPLPFAGRRPLDIPVVFPDNITIS